MVRSSTNARKSPTDSFDALKDDIAALKRDLSALLGERMGDVSDRTKEFLHDGAEQAKAVHNRVGEFAGSKPLVTIAISALAGAVGVKLLGWMFRQ